VAAAVDAGNSVQIDTDGLTWARIVPVEPD
jgi:antitoxin (DNA-binding transcriptional repressor) of toxin-antitoxin stability system